MGPSHTSTSARRQDTAASHRETKRPYVILAAPTSFEQNDSHSLPSSSAGHRWSYLPLGHSTVANFIVRIIA